MAKYINYYILDVFARQQLSRNQLAVFIDLEQTLSSEQMLAMTLNVNFAESAFIRSRKSGSTLKVQIFTTKCKGPFARHPCLGSTYIIAKHLM